MIIVLKPNATKKQRDHILEKIKDLGFETMVSEGVERTIIGVIGEEDLLRVTPLEAFPGVEKVLSVLKPYKLVSREFKPDSTVVDVSGQLVGLVLAGLLAGAGLVVGGCSFVRKYSGKTEINLLCIACWSFSAAG